MTHYFSHSVQDCSTSISSCLFKTQSALIGQRSQAWAGNAHSLYLCVWIYSCAGGALPVSLWHHNFTEYLYSSFKKTVAAGWLTVLVYHLNKNTTQRNFTSYIMWSIKSLCCCIGRFLLTLISQTLTRFYHCCRVISRHSVPPLWDSL